MVRYRQYAAPRLRAHRAFFTGDSTCWPQVPNSATSTSVSICWEAGRVIRIYTIRVRRYPASVQQGIGAGIKVGLFPHFTKRVVGLELDSFAHGGALSFPNNANGQDNGIGRSNFLILNTMFNLVLRYPGEVVMPYVGIGAGWSQGTLLNPNITGRADKDFESARALGHQYLAGVRTMVSPKVFIFGEYRYFSANYHWEGLAVDFRAHYGLFGIGLHF